MTKKELQERLNTLATQIREKGEQFEKQEKRWEDDAERTAWEKLNTDYNETRTKLDEVLQAETVEARMTEVRDFQERSINSRVGLPGREDTDQGSRQARDEITEETRCLALQAYFRDSLGQPLKKRHVQAMRACRMRPGQKILRFSAAPTRLVRSWQRQIQGRHHEAISSLLHEERSSYQAELRALNNYQLSAGAALVPGSFIQSFEINMLAFGGMRQVAETIVTQSGEEMSWPTGDDTGNEGEQLGEGETETDVEPTFALLKWRAYKFSSKPLKVDYSLLEDAFLDLPMTLGEMLGERVGRITNRKFTLGSGNATCLGIVPASEMGATTSGQAITYDDVIKVEHSVDPGYRLGAGYMCHDSILLAVRLLKDGNSQYLWQNGIDVGKPDTLNGRPLTINQHMDSTTVTGNKVLLFGQLNKYKIRRVREIRLYRMEERYRDQDQDGFIALVREDGNLLNAGTCPVKHVLIG